MSLTAILTTQLQTRFAPLHLEVHNESHQHAVPPGAESHFKVIIVSSEFAPLGLVQRHRAVNAVLAPLFQQGLHALALHTLTPEEWYAQGGQVPASPPCLGGSKS